MRKGQNYYLWEGWTGLIACLLAEGNVPISAGGTESDYLHNSDIANANLRDLPPEPGNLSVDDYMLSGVLRCSRISHGNEPEENRG